MSVSGTNGNNEVLRNMLLVLELGLQNHIYMYIFDMYNFSTLFNLFISPYLYLYPNSG